MILSAGVNSPVDLLRYKKQKDFLKHKINKG